MSSDKSLPPSQRRRDLAREQGRVAKSADLCSAGMILLGGLLLLFLGGTIVAFAGERMSEGILGAATLDDPMPLVSETAESILWMIAPFALAVIVCAAAFNIAQVGWHPTVQPIVPDAGRIVPRFERILSGKAGVRTLFAVLKILLVLGVVVWTAWERRTTWVETSGSGTAELGAWVAKTGTLALLRCAILLLFLAMFDYFWQRGRHEKDLALSPSEAARELRESEGDPHMKRARQAIHRERVASLSGWVVSDGDRMAVVLTRPGARAPSVVSVAGGGQARTLLRTARTRGMHVVEDSTLAQALSRCRGAVPQALYNEVAEAWVQA
jgi:flagellar biosynthetic protein FlhB